MSSHRCQRSKQPTELITSCRRHRTLRVGMTGYIAIDSRLIMVLEYAVDGTAIPEVYFDIGMGSCKQPLPLHID